MTLHGLVPELSDPVLVKGLLQVVAATALALAVLAVAWVRDLDLETELGGALVRGFVQVLAIGSVVGVLLTAPFAWSLVVLAGMVGAAAWISRDRGPGLDGAFRTSLAAIAVGSGITIATMTWAGAIEADVRNLIPVGSMIIYAAMKTNSLALERLTSEVRDHRDRIEAGLALGASPAAAVAPFARRGVRASLIPVVDSLRSLGFVWIPGMMAGMILSGAHPLYAAEYQFVIMAMVFGAAGLTAVTTSVLVPTKLFDDAEQLRELGGPG